MFAIATISAQTHDNDLAITLPDLPPATAWGVLNMTPVSQTIPSTVIVNNVGTTEQTNIVLSVTRNGVHVGTSEPLATLAPGESEIMELTLPIIPVVGINEIVFTVTQAETDGDLTDNTVTRTFTRTLNAFSVDNNVHTGNVASAPNHHYGNIFTITEETEIRTIQARFVATVGSDIQNVTVSIRPVLIFPIPATATPDVVGPAIVTSDPFTRPAVGPGWMNIEITPTVLQPGHYFVSVRQGAANLSLAASAVGTGPQVPVIGDAGNLMTLFGNGPAHIRILEYVSGACPAPTNLATTDVTQHNVSFTWDQVTNNYLFRVYRGNTVGENFISQTITTDNFIEALGRFEPETTLSWTVTAICGAGNTTTVEGPAVTTLACPQAVVGPAFAQNFGGEAFPPLCWDNVIEADVATWHRNTTTPLGGTVAHARHPNNNLVQTSMLITEAIEIPVTGAYSLNFSNRFVFGRDGGSFTVLVSETTREVAEFEPIESFTPPSTTGTSPWTEAELSLADFAGKTIFIGFRVEANEGTAWTAGWDISNISIEPLPVEVISKTPYDGEDDVLLGEYIEVVFSQVVTPGANFGDIAVTPALAGFDAEIVGRTLIITHNGLTPETEHTVTIPAGTIDGYDEIITWSFTTGEAPLVIEVLSKTPAVGATDVALDANIVVTFSQDVDFANGFAGITITYAGGTVAVTNATIATRYLTISHAGFDYETTYTVTIPAGTIDGYDEIITWSFTTGEAPLVIEVLSKTPAVGATDVALDANIVVTFNQDVDFANGFAGITITYAGGTVAVTNATIATGYLTISHAGFDYETAYTVTIPAGTIDGYDEIITWSFTTVAGETSIQIPGATTAMVIFYPNPVEDILHIETTETVRQIEIFNLQGILVMVVEGNATSINVSSLPAGTYMIRLTTETGVSTQRFVKR